MEMLEGTNIIEFDNDKAELNLLENQFNEEDGEGEDVKD